jgi:hypothetical protein
MAQPLPPPFIVAGSAPGFATETSVAKQSTAPYGIMNAAGSLSPAAVAGATVNILGALAQENDGTPGSVVIHVPPTPGLYAILVDFNSANTVFNVSTISYYGRSYTDASNAAPRWIGGSTSSIVTGNGNNSIQLLPTANASTMTILNWSTTPLVAGGTATYIQLSAAIPGL